MDHDVDRSTTRPDAPELRAGWARQASPDPVTTGVVIACAACGREVRRRRAWQRFCSDACRHTAWWRRQLGRAEQT